MKTGTCMIGGRSCAVFEQGANGPVLYVGTGRDEAEAVAQKLAALTGDAAWRLVAFETENWNAYFSPWPAPAVFAREDFAGQAQQTLDWLINECIPAVETDHRTVRGIAGYSLAGLFSLWAFYESGLFQGAASCSGSLWYPGWKEYAQEHQAPAGSSVYLSLGDKEEKTRNRAMACVGDRTRWMAERLEADEHILRHTLQWHAGGHFNEPDARLAQGLAWLVSVLRPD